MFRTLAMTLAAAAFVPAAAQAQNLRYAHFMSPNSWQHEQIFQDWAEAVKDASDGEVTVTVFPAQTLGKAPAGYDNAINRITDIAWTVQGYTAGRFPLSQIMELPGLFDTGAVGSCAFQKLYDSGALDEEYDQTHVLFVHTHDPGHLHTAGTPVKTLADLEGLKIRRPTAVVGDMLDRLGAEPIGLPAPQTYESLQRGTIDGYMLPWESVESFRLEELTDYHTEFGFYALAFVATMNKDVYESLTPEAKAAIDANSGMDWAVTAGRGYDEAGAKVLAGLDPETVIMLDPEERARWEAATAETTQAYIKELDDKGLPGTATYEAVKGYVSECEAELG
ncbi:TRAP transporter substrate-binding protein [Chachezhania antarctica]|mgnify:CR=1 FL=1|uniref:TRAP transporter substrate-binding protein n=1 Tax=Chachezhania antarctica TaxID=2340860 RepID=UPI000EB530E9|nr:TRAP transporter substrate-binding protein [Chachezhania antarctica]